MESYDQGVKDGLESAADAIIIFADDLLRRAAALSPEDRAATFTCSVVVDQTLRALAPIIRAITPAKGN